MMMDPMIHLTLNTGNSITVPAGKVSPEARRTLKGMVIKKGDLIPHFAPWRTVIERGAGYSSFDIRRNKMGIVVINVVAWTESGAEAAWSILEGAYLAAGDALAKAGVSMPMEMPEMPGSLPWLATWLLPQGMMAVNLRELGWMSDFEQCLAVTILEHAKSQDPG